MAVFNFNSIEYASHTLECTYCYLTHWGRATHIFVSKLNIIASDNVLSPGRRQAFICNNDEILSINTQVKCSRLQQWHRNSEKGFCHILRKTKILLFENIISIISTIMPQINEHGILNQSFKIMYNTSRLYLWDTGTECFAKIWLYLRRGNKVTQMKFIILWNIELCVNTYEKNIIKNNYSSPLCQT